MATKFAPPPIQLPARADRPRQASSGNHGPVISNAIGPPITTLNVPVRSMISALGPKRKMPGRSSASTMSNKLAGSTNFLIHSYSGDESGMIPSVVSNVGTK